LERTTAAAADVEKILANTPGVQYTTSVVGFSLLSFVRTSYNAFFFVTFKPWDRAHVTRRTVPSDQGTSEPGIAAVRACGIAFSFSPPAIPGVGASGGFYFRLEDRAGNDVHFRGQESGARFWKRPANAGDCGLVLATFLAGVPQEFVQVGPRQSPEARCPVAPQRCLPDDPKLSWAVISLTISTASAVSGRFTSRRKAKIAPRWKRRTILRSQ